MRFLRTNTAARITVGPFLDKTDGITPEVSLTVTSEKLTFMVDVANVPTLVLDVAPTASGGANDMVHVTGDDAGFYDLELAAADVNYLGRAMLAITDAATHCPVFHEFMLLPAMIYDAGVLGTDRLDANVTHVADTAQTARDLGLSVLLSSGTGTGEVKLANGYVAPNWGDVGNPTTTVGLSGTTVKTATDIATATTQIQADTDDIQTRLPTALTSGGNMKAGVQGFLDSVFTEGAVGRLAAAFKQFFNVATPAATMDHGVLTDTVTTAGNVPSAADVADAICDEVLSGHTTSGTVGKALGDTLADVLALHNLSTAEVLAQVQSALTATIADAVPADGTRPSVASGIYGIYQFLTERDVNGLILTVKKPDGSTALMTFTLNSATQPTSITRTT